MSIVTNTRLPKAIISEDGFHHLVYSISGTTHTLFLDNNQIAVNISGGNVFSSYQTISKLFCGIAGDLSYRYTGYIDDFKIFNRSLTKTDVSSIYYLNESLPTPLMKDTILSLPTATYGTTITGLSINDYGYMIMPCSGKGIFYSKNYGATWSISDAPTTFAWLNVYMTNSGYAIACTSTQVFVSDNHGVNWTQTNITAPSTIASSNNPPFSKVTINDYGNAIVAASAITTYSQYSSISYSSPPYTTWTKVMITSDSINSISISNNGYCLLSGNSSVHVSSNYGISWVSKAGSWTSSLSPNGKYYSVLEAGGKNHIYGPHIIYSTDNYVTLNQSLSIGSRMSFFGKVVVANNGMVLANGGTTIPGTITPAGSFIYKLDLSNNGPFTHINYAYSTFNGEALAITPKGDIGAMIIGAPASPTLLVINLNFMASGGNFIKVAGGYKYHVFTTSSFLDVSLNSGVKQIEYLIVGGGGAGGTNYGGGGGAGEVISGTIMCTSNKRYSIVVGAGGINGDINSNGNLSSFNSIVANGGGRGGGVTTGSASQGGSGGGGSGGSNLIDISGATYDGYFGYKGGNGFPNGSGGGGGGSGGSGDNGTAVGTNSTASGGIGTNLYSTWLIDIVSVMTIPSNWGTKTVLTGVRYIASGGAGGTSSRTTAVPTNIGGGGNGGTPGTTTPRLPEAGTNYTGGGGGGGGNGQSGANGGTGIVIIRYA